MIQTQKRRIREASLFNSLDASISEKPINKFRSFEGREKLFNCPANSWMGKFWRIYEGDELLTDHWTNTAQSFVGIPVLRDCSPGYMKETPRRRITVKSSLRSPGINSLPAKRAGTSIFDVPARQATKAGRIDSLELIPGLGEHFSKFGLWLLARYLKTNCRVFPPCTSDICLMSANHC